MPAVRTAVVGYGIVGAALHVPILIDHPDAELVGICDSDQERLEAAASSFPSIPRYSDHTTLFQEEELDSVHVCVPPQFHFDFVDYFAPKAVSVLLEKPAATSSVEVERMQELSAAHDTTVSVVHNRLFTPQMRGALASVRDGDIGDVVSISMRYSEDRDLTETRRGNWVFDLPGAELGEGLVHQVYLPLAFVDGLGQIDSVVFNNYAGYDNLVRFDGVNINLSDTNGARSVNISVTMSSVDGSFIHVFGTEGELIIPRNLVGSYVIKHRNVVTNTIRFATSALANVGQKAGDALVRQVYAAVGDSRSRRNDGHYVQIDRYLRSLRQDSEPPVTLKQAYDSVRVLEALERADPRG